jgi:hypothetical protein
MQICPGPQSQSAMNPAAARMRNALAGKTALPPRHTQDCRHPGRMLPMFHRRPLLVPLLIGAMAPILAPAAATSDLPAAVNTLIEPAAAMAKMETAVPPGVLEAFKKQHPATFWLFGEDRQLAIRNAIIPAHWFDGEAPQFQQFHGVARPGEFYVFQVGLLPGDAQPKVECGILFDALKDAQTTVLSGHLAANASDPEPYFGLVFDDPRYATPRRDPVMPIWIGIQIPQTARAGSYEGRVRFRNASTADGPGAALIAPLQEQLTFTIKVEGAPVTNSGTAEAWRLARLKWLNSTIGTSTTEVTRPFTPIKLNEATRSLDILGRRITLAPNGIPAQFTSFFSGSNTRILAAGREAFAAPPTLECLVAGQPVDWQTDSITWQHSPVTVKWDVASRGGGMTMLVRGELEYDGNLKLRVNLSSINSPVQVADLRLVVPWRKDVARYAMGLGLQGGRCPDRLDWKWDVSNHQDAIWMGDVNLGAMLRFKDDSNYHRPLINAYYDFLPLALPPSWGAGNIRLDTTDTTTTLTASAGPKTVPPGGGGAGGCHFDIDWYFTPFKPINVKQHFDDRYHHATQGTTLADTAALKKEGVSIIEIHHNQLCNPYINYPYNEDSFPHLLDLVHKAHDAGLRANLYYTTRELTQNLPEFFALKSMAGEIILPRKEGVAWPVTNSGGPHPWLTAHVGSDIVPAWRENLKFPQYRQSLDLAVITTPDSRWNNFYLEGLDYLVKQAGIDGLYIDDTALDRKSMQRARRILDADGNPGRRVNMHSWNHFNALAKWSNRSIAFMDLYPYYDGLWHGEGFNANASPEYMLVEMSGIPYGLMSEMLDQPNPWHGMVFGMRTRWPWSGDPRPIWQLEDQFGIATAEYLGWWDAACPVTTDNPQVKASVYRKQGRTLIALASWAPHKTEVKLSINWAALGLAERKTTLWAPECKGFQAESVFTPEAAIPIGPNKGWLLLADETPRG